MQDKQKLKWLALSVGGLTLLGLGISVIGESIILKSKGDNWFWWGTIGLVIFNSGICVFGEAVKTAVLMQIRS